MDRKKHLSAKQFGVACGILVVVTVVLCLVFSSLHKGGLTGKVDMMLPKEDSFEEFCQALYVREMTANTLGLHYSLAHPENFGISEYPVTLPLYVPGSEEAAAESLDALWEEFHGFSREDLSSEDQYAYDCLERTLLLSTKLAEFPYYGDPLSPTQGIQEELPILLSEYAFLSRKDVEEYLTLLAQTEKYFASLLTYEVEKANAGLSPSSDSLRQTAEQCDEIITREALEQGTHFLQTSFEERLRELSLTEAEVHAYVAKHESLLVRVLLPAYEELKNGLLLLAEQAPEGSLSLTSYPNGKEYYALLLASITGSGKTPEEIRQLLEQTLSRELKAIRQLTEKYPGCLSSLRSRSYEDLGLTRETQMLTDLQERMQGLYPELPQKVHVTVKTVSPNLRPYCAPAFYLTAPIDDVSDNVIYVNPSSTPQGLELYVTLAHEGFPGHLYQNAFSADNLLSLKHNHLRQLCGCGGYLEGWALYVEQNAYDFASKLLADQDRAADAVCVQIAKHERSLRLCLFALLDLMIHYDGASLEEITKFTSVYGVTDEEGLAALYAYICQTPCNYPKYYLGYLEILELRETAKTLWGDTFSAERFHRFLLTWGPADFVNLKNVLENHG
ncbi:MAG: DUF885 domain-containing protein [Lachnospiraceae bacterium]|nr:DUF885 domain-containing protein [Lachnospiraceae bacterium]